MNKILIALDMGPLSYNQLVYALRWAETLQSQLHVIHVYQIPVVSADSFVYVPDASSLEEIRKTKKDNLQTLIHQVIHDTKINQPATLDCVFGQPSEVIESIAKENHCDLIILGLHNQSYLAERLLGSTTTFLFRHGSIPVLAIHQESHLVELKNILFAYDRKPFSNKSILQPLVKISEAFDARIHIVTIETEIEDFPLISESLIDEKLDAMPDLNRVSYHVVQKENVVDGLKEYCAQHDIDLIVLVPRKHHFFERLVTESSSKKIAYHLDIPVLALHD